MAKIRYSEFQHRIDLDQLYEAIGFNFIEHRKGEDVGYCFDIWGLHKNGDTTGKLGINPEKMVYNCWVCGGGSILSLVRDLYDWELDDCLDFLYKFTQAKDATDDEFLDEISALLRPLTSDKEVLPYYNERVLKPWQLGIDAEEFLIIEKGITEKEIWWSYGVGYNPETKKYAPRNKQTGEFLDETFVGPALVFPHYWNGKLVGWQNRWLTDERPKWCAKYTNTPDFPKAETLYGYDQVRRRSHPIVITESVTTVLRLACLDIPAVATFGASVSNRQKKLLRRFQQGVIIAPDNDSAGIKMLIELADYLEGFVPVSYIEPDGHPGENLGDVADPGEIQHRILNAERTY